MSLPYLEIGIVIINRIQFQQQKALKVLKIPMDIRDTILEYGVFGKIPVEYRKYNPVEIFQIMLSKNMNPGSVKEFRRCMKQILNK